MENKKNDYCEKCLHAGICMYEKKYEELTSASIMELLDVDENGPFRVKVECDKRLLGNIPINYQQPAYRTPAERAQVPPTVTTGSTMNPNNPNDIEIPDFLKSKQQLAPDIASKLEKFANDIIDDPNGTGGKITSRELK